MSSVAQQSPRIAKGQVLRANPAIQADWPATFIFVNRKGDFCTATAVGPNVVLTAAHCIPDDAQALVASGDTNTLITCKHHPAYPANPAADFALCRAADALSRPEGGFEKVNIDVTLLKIGNDLLLLGYGCIAENASERTFGVLYEGPATIRQLPLEQSAFIQTEGGAALCSGDSGGGAYHFLDDGKTIRRLVGVNAQGDVHTRSLIAATSTNLFLDWARGWSKDNAAGICGVEQPLAGCKQ